MADIQTTTNELKIDLLFNDTDTRTITLKNPKDTITASEIQALNTEMLNGGTNTLLVSDKTGATFNRITTVTKISQMKTNIDLT